MRILFNKINAVQPGLAFKAEPNKLLLDIRQKISSSYDSIDCIIKDLREYKEIIDQYIYQLKFTPEIRELLLTCVGDAKKSKKLLGDLLKVKGPIEVITALRSVYFSRFQDIDFFIDQYLLPLLKRCEDKEDRAPLIILLANLYYSTQRFDQYLKTMELIFHDPQMLLTQEFKKNPEYLITKNCLVLIDQKKVPISDAYKTTFSSSFNESEEVPHCSLLLTLMSIDELMNTKQYAAAAKLINGTIDTLIDFDKLRTIGNKSLVNYLNKLREGYPDNSWRFINKLNAFEDITEQLAGWFVGKSSDFYNFEINKMLQTKIKTESKLKGLPPEESENLVFVLGEVLQTKIKVLNWIKIYQLFANYLDNRVQIIRSRDPESRSLLNGFTAFFQNHKWLREAKLESLVLEDRVKSQMRHGCLDVTLAEYSQQDRSHIRSLIPYLERLNSADIEVQILLYRLYLLINEGTNAQKILDGIYTDESLAAFKERFRMLEGAQKFLKKQSMEIKQLQELSEQLKKYDGIQSPAEKMFYQLPANLPDLQVQLAQKIEDLKFEAEIQLRKQMGLSGIGIIDDLVADDLFNDPKKLDDFNENLEDPKFPREKDIFVNSTFNGAIEQPQQPDYKFPLTELPENPITKYLHNVVYDIDRKQRILNVTFVSGSLNITIKINSRGEVISTDAEFAELKETLRRLAISIFNENVNPALQGSSLEDMEKRKQFVYESIEYSPERKAEIYREYLVWENRDIFFDHDDYPNPFLADYFRRDKDTGKLIPLLGVKKAELGPNTEDIVVLRAIDPIRVFINRSNPKAKCSGEAIERCAAYELRDKGLLKTSVEEYLESIKQKKVRPSETRLRYDPDQKVFYFDPKGVRFDEESRTRIGGFATTFRSFSIRDFKLVSKREKK